MATVDPRPTDRQQGSLFDEEGFPWLENGERMDQKTFHERYKQTPPGFKAELIGGIVYVMSPSLNRHGRHDARLSGWLFTYCVATPGSEVQDNTTTILGDDSEPQPDSALLILPEFGGQTRSGVDEDDDYTYGSPEFIAEVAVSSTGIYRRAKLADYERAGTREYLVLDVRGRKVHWFSLVDGHFVPVPHDADGLIRSRFFPGLWLDPESLVKNDKRRLIEALNLGLASPEHAAFVDQLQRCHDHP